MDGSDTAEAANPAAKTANVEPRERSGVQSLARAFSIIEVVAAHSEGISLGDLSKRVGLHNSTAYHLVRTMVSLGYVRQNPNTKQYHLGRKVFALAASSRNDIEFVALAEPILDKLSNTTGESAHLAIFSDNEVVVVVRSAGTGAFQLRESHGGVRPGHATALGKVLLASLDRRQLDQYLDSHPLEPLTGKTITDRARLLAELEEVRASGVAYDDGEFNSEVRCVAAAVRDFTGKFVAAVGLSAPVWRLTLQALHRHTNEVQGAASALSEELGWQRLST